MSQFVTVNGGELKRQRERRKMTRRELAGASGVAVSTIYRLEASGWVGTRRLNVAALAKALNIAVKRLEADDD